MKLNMSIMKAMLRMPFFIIMAYKNYVLYVTGLL